MIIDSHVHLITASAIRELNKSFRRHASVRLLDRALLRRGGAFRDPKFLKFLDKTDLPTMAQMWVEQLDRNKIDHAIFLPITGQSTQEVDEFVSIRPDRFSGYLMLEEPDKKSAVTAIRRWIGKGNIRGIKLYPCLSGVSVADKRLFPVYEAAAELNAPILIHFGITTAPVSDYRFTNPLDLQLPARLFPDTKFIVAHFGAGFFRELLLIGFHADNIYVDTSGTNNWRSFLPEIMPLSDIFRRTIDVYGADKILYGTDTLLNGRDGYRAFVLKEQKQAMAKLRMSKENRARIMGANTAALFGIDSQGT